MPKVSEEFPTFEEFFTALLEVGEPYQWQAALAQQVKEQGFPREISVPTGLGKTSIIAVWLYELARQVHYGEPRTAPMRLFYVVNRRSVVDQGQRYAESLRKALDTPLRGSVLEPVRRALSTLLPPGDNRLFVTAAIHGESPDDKAWMRATGATAVSLTPAQLVSRALMRGINVSDLTRSIHAGLVGVDRLIVFDEPHLSAASIQALEDQGRLQRRAVDLGVPLGTTVLLGATMPKTSGPRGASDEVRSSGEGVSTSPFEFNQELNLTNPQARRRLLAHKSLELIATRNTSAATLATQGRRFVEQMNADGKERLLLVLNTVGAAQRVYEALLKMPTKKRPPNIALLTSRFRGVEKPPVQDLEAGPLVLVATQTVEVGLDISFDALFTEATSFDALVQRLGRLNRDGAHKEAPAKLVAQGGQGTPFVVSKPTAHIYGEKQVQAALRLLEAHEVDGRVDASPLALEKLRELGGPSLQTQPPRAATLHSGLLPVLVQTAPTPISDIPVEAFIAGPDEGAARDTEVAWRRELAPLDVPKKKDAAGPLPGEYVSVPMTQLRAFLEGRSLNEQVGDTLDLDEVARRGRQLPRDRVETLRVLNPGATAWTTVLSTDQIKPGAKVVLLDRLGGYNPELGWMPSSTEQVPTVQLPALEQSLARQRAAASVRYPKRLRLVVADGLKTEVKGTALEDVVTSVLDAQRDYYEAESGTPEEVRVAGEHLTFEANQLIQAITAGDGRRASYRSVTGSSFKGGVVLDIQLVGGSPEKGSSRPVFLDVHSRQVAAWARGAALAAGLLPALAGALEQAGLFHDAGKAWEPYQQQFGVDDSDQPGRLLAKSLPLLSDDGIKRATAPSAHDVPPGWRHEVNSIAYIPAKVPNRPLVEHFVLSHHGWGRPWINAENAAAGDDEVVAAPYGVGRAKEFLALNERFGPWGLAYLEAVLRLADWTASASPDDGGGAAELNPAKRPAVKDQPSTSEEDTGRVEHEHRLVGLAQFPVASWFAAVGLLVAAHETGDQRARIRWEGAGGLQAVAPVLPVLTSRFSLRQLVEEVIGSKQWSQTKTLLSDEGCRPFDVKFQKMGPVGALRNLLLRADSERALLILGSISDAVPSERDLVPMAIPAFPNVSSYPGSATSAGASADAVDRGVEALANPNAGYAVRAADGGLDRPEDYDPAVTGTVGKDRRLVRDALAPLVLWGMTEWGTVPPRGYGCGAKRISLPLPSEPVSLVELRALTLLADRPQRRGYATGGVEWFLSGEKKFDGVTKQEWWVARPKLVEDREA